MSCLPCGHVHCSPCTERYIECTKSIRGQYPCPQCRTRFRQSEKHSIFVECADSASQAAAGASGSGVPACHSDALHRQIGLALREVRSLEEDQRSQTVQRAAKEIQKVSELLGRRDCMLDLLVAVAARWHGMLALFTSISDQRGEITKFKSLLEEVQTAKAAAENTAHEAIKTSEAMMPALQQSRSELQEAKETVAELRNKMERTATAHRAEVERKNQEVGSLHDHLRALKVQEQKQKHEIKRLREKIKAQAATMLQTQSIEPMWDDVTDSLSVLPPGLVNDFQDAEGAPFMEDQSAVQQYLSSSRKRKRTADEEMPTLDENSQTVIHSPLSSPSSYPRRQAPRRELAIKTPVFGSEWNLPPSHIPAKQRQTKGSVPRSISDSATFPLKLDSKGRPLVPVQNGSRRKTKF